MTKIELTNENFHHLSFADSMQLINYNGQLLRGVAERNSGFIKRLFTDGVMDTLVSRGYFVPSEITELFSDEFPLIVQHKRISRITYPTEWSPEAFKTAALLVLDLQEVLLSKGYILNDVHPWNILYDKGKPVFVDLGAISSFHMSAALHAYEQIQEYYLYPLKLAAMGRWLYVPMIFSGYRSVTHEDFHILSSELSFRYLYREIIKKLPLKAEISAIWFKKLLSVYRRSKTLTKNKAIIRDFSRKFANAKFANARKQIEKIKFAESNSIANGGREFILNQKSVEKTDGWDIRQQSIKNVLSRLCPQSCLEMCSKDGWFSLLSEKMGIETVVVDVSPQTINQLFRITNKNSLNIVPVVMDFNFPTPATGLANQWFKPATERLKCEMVVFLQSIHEVVFSTLTLVSFDQVVKGLHGFTSRWLLIEFIPLNDILVTQPSQPLIVTNQAESWYTEENLISALEYQFFVREKFPSDKLGRTLLLCERKDHSR